VFKVYPLNSENALFLISLVLLLVGINIIILGLSCFYKSSKVVLIILLLFSSLSAYFMDTYHIVIDDTMIDNILQTDVNESLDLFSFQQVIYILLLGVLPSIVVWRVNIRPSSLKKAFFNRLLLIVGVLLGLALLILSLSNFYASFAREHKSLRLYANPSYYVYSSIKYVSSFFESAQIPFQKIALDAKISTDEHRELIVFVVGETARADHFSLNGYKKETNPYLEKEDVISFDNVWACGTSTAHSVPCMFSIYTRDNFSKSKAKNTENALDVLKRAGVNVLWLDNNSNSKGVADRVDYQSFKSSDVNPICDIECRDEGMLYNLQAYIDAHPKGDIFIVLHQMGNHGPAYYKRYPAEFERFKPLCKTNQLEKCTVEEINNAYDNALLYTDYFLSKVIKILRNNDDIFESVLLYASDHGESLGEDNLYLHGLPYLIAPDSQKNMPLIMWFGSGFEKEEIDFKAVRSRAHKKLSHDNLFHTILGLMEIQTEVYNEKMDILK
jgi:lipid A ethanolaminephosphotransferase